MADVNRYLLYTTNPDLNRQNHRRAILINTRPPDGELFVGTGEYANVHFQTTRSCSSLDAADRRSEDTQAEGTYRRAISLSRSSGNSATGGRSHPLFILRTNQIGGSSLAGIESPRSAMLNVRFGEQSQVERAIRRDFAASPTQVATSAQCHTLDGTGK